VKKRMNFVAICESNNVKEYAVIEHFIEKEKHVEFF
jgi:hypothetical protein